ncbi:DUF1015 domain-containing protein [Clostridium sp. cel8]|jgi:uncharacterized protein (DUF1015 family)|uniref:DUF1015 domain-containing protein n=1 Tax=Clostridium sp. cel8 TaxID=2663123 RepID=UPI0015F534D9|nr:DUF1015 family protein [Clostridium sp. cel8]MBA5851801.1 DUF1015 domain-containing protein [Clostridium sp. cel8]
MAIIKPFKAIRPRNDLASKVAALPYDVMSSSEAREKVKGNKYSFLHVDKAEVDLDKSIDIYDKRVYEKARENLNKMIEENVLIEDKKPCLYIYRLTMNGKSQTGIVGCTSIDEYMNNKIKKHENTRQDKEIDRINHVDYCNANTGPIFMTYRNNKEINNIIDSWIKKDPVYDFKADDGVFHKVWVIDDDDVILDIQNAFKNIDSLYIADGHHRAASAVKVGLKRRKEKVNYNGNEEFNFFLSVVFPDSDLRIIDYNRVVKDLNGLDTKDYFNKIREKFEVSLYEEEGQFKPCKEHTYGMYLDGKWYVLKAKENSYNSKDVVSSLDVSILQDNLLEPVLGIKDPRQDSRIDFIGGIRGLKELERKVDSGEYKVAFSMYPVTLEELMKIADEGKVMPPKSTWFEPKLRSGLFVHKLG